MSPSVDRFARDIADRLDRQERAIRDIANKADLGKSSFEDGSLDAYSGGQLSLIVGKQYDGSTVASSVSGPVPPQPSAPITLGGITAVIRWDGLYYGDPTIVAPMDFSRVEIHASTDPNFLPDGASTLTDTFESPRGGEKTISLPNGTWYVRFVTRTIPGNFSSPSAVVPVTVNKPATSAELEAMRAAFNSDMQALDTNLDTLGTSLTAAEGRLDTAESELDNAFTRLGSAETAVATAVADAAAAESAATEAVSKAAQAAADAEAAEASATTSAADLAAARTAATNAQAAADAAAADVVEANAAVTAAQTKANEAAAAAEQARLRAVEAEGSASTATGAAAAAEAAADASATDAYNALQQAQAAGGNATAAQTAATNAQAAADTAAAQATAAGTAAAQADADAAQAAADAAQAVADAAAAAASASTAAGKATTAAADAETARQRAVAAESSATTATGAAAAAEAAADASATDAYNALQQAQAAGGNASAAQTAATAAQTAADTAKAQATSAGTAAAAADAAAAQAAADAAQAVADAALAAQNAANAAASASDSAGSASSAQEAAQAAQTAAGRNTAVFYSTSAPPATNTNGRTGDTWRQQVSSTDKNIKAEWYWDGGAWRSQKLTSDQMSSLDVGKLSAGSAAIVDLVAQKIAAASGQYINLDVKQLTVTDSALIKTGVAESFFTKYFTTNRLSANQVYIGPGANAIADPFFEDEVIKDNRHTMSTVPGLWSRDATLNLNRYGGAFAAGTSRLFYYNAMPDSLANKAAFIPVFPGDRWKVRAKVRTVGGGARIIMRFITKDGLTGQTPTGMKSTAYSAAGTVDIENEYTVSSSVAYIMPCIQFDTTCTEAYVYGGAELRAMTDGSLVVEGSINGQLITGGVFQTHAAANQGLKLIGNGFAHGLPENDAFVAYNAGGVKTVHIDGVDNQLTGRLATNAPGSPGFIFVPKTSTGQPGMWLSSTGGTASTEASIYADSGWNLVLRGKSDSFGFRGAIQIEGGFSVLSGGVGMKNQSWAIGDTGTGFFNQLRVADDVVSKYFRTAYPGGAGLVLLNTDAGQPGIWFSSNGSLTADQPAIFAGSDYRVYFRGKAAGAANLTVTTGMRIASDLEYWDPPTSTFGANLGIASSPKDRIYKLTSNPKFKLDMRPQTLEKAMRLLKVMPIDWYDKFQAEKYAAYMAGDPDVTLDQIPPLRRIPGLSAQDVLDAGLDEYVTYDHNGELEGIYYDRLWVLLILLVQHLWGQMETMQADIAQLKEKVGI